MVVARRQPRNPEGWLLLGLAVCGIALLDSGLYAVLDYRVHHGLLPLGEPAVFIKDTVGTSVIFLFPLVICFSRTRGCPGGGDGCCGRIWFWSRCSRSVVSLTRSVPPPGGASRST